MNPPWVLVDVSYLAHRALHSTGDLEYEETPTGVLYGLLTQLRTICQDPVVKSNRIVLFFDSGKSYRANVFPDYKKKRKDRRTPAERADISRLWKQVRLAREKVFPLIGIPCYRQTGLESDDLIAQAALQITERGDRSIIISADGDLLQCITDTCEWYDPGRKTRHTISSMETVKGIAPSLWGRVKSLAGCQTDNVPGIPGVGVTTAIKFLNGTLPSKYKAFKAIVSPTGKRIAARNARLVVLPHAKTLELPYLRPPVFDVKEFFEVCKQYGLKSFLAKKNGWVNFFNGPQRGLLSSRRNHNDNASD